ncbi:MAG: triphosphoribosyl-dephospho-CoA synthase [Methylobacter sp.]|nr:triphosphoribosyl-dephospho-CoA synthase [Methylobacter sp.]
MYVSPKELCELYRQACDVDVQAFKPGNVSVYADGHDMTVADFRLSAEVSATPLCNPEYCLGEKIYYAVKATREAVGCNTNLGIILLCAPLIQSISYKSSVLTLRQAVCKVIIESTIDDADWVFKAISLASPGGLGQSDEQDVNEKASVNLLEAMKIASFKDLIALQYLNGYEDIFNFAVIRYKYGNQYTKWVATKMAQLSEELLKTDNPEQLKPMLYALDQELKLYDVNPGTTADMIVATVLTTFLEDLNQ